MTTTSTACRSARYEEGFCRHVLLSRSYQPERQRARTGRQLHSFNPTSRGCHHRRGSYGGFELLRRVRRRGKGTGRAGRRTDFGAPRCARPAAKHGLVSRRTQLLRRPPRQRLQPNRLHFDGNDAAREGPRSFDKRSSLRTRRLHCTFPLTTWTSMQYEQSATEAEECSEEAASESAGANGSRGKPKQLRRRPNKQQQTTRAVFLDDERVDPSGLLPLGDRRDRGTEVRSRRRPLRRRHLLLQRQTGVPVTSRGPFGLAST